MTLRELIKKLQELENNPENVNKEVKFYSLDAGFKLEINQIYKDNSYICLTDYPFKVK